MVYAHGNNQSAEGHFGVPMIMASHGYCVLVPTFSDGSPKWHQDNKGNDIWPNEGDPNFPKKLINKVANPVHWEKQKEAFDKRYDREGTMEY